VVASVSSFLLLLRCLTLFLTVRIPGITLSLLLSIDSLLFRSSSIRLSSSRDGFLLNLMLTRLFRLSLFVGESKPEEELMLMLF
jgi:hypothetical protein